MGLTRRFASIAQKKSDKKRKKCEKKKKQTPVPCGLDWTERIKTAG
jgi:hypothetical protein